MQCPRCEFENRDHAKFCGGCGAELMVLCEACGAQNPLAVAFCDQCGAALAAADAPAGGVAEPVVNGGYSVSDAQRRQLSFMCCDIVDSTIITQTLDPEEWRRALSGFQRICEATTVKYGGHYAQDQGDGMVGYFCHPIAYEDDAERAVLAGLEIIEAQRRLNRELVRDIGVELHLRVGVDTGEVVIGDIRSPHPHERVAAGEAPTIASRVQEEAEPDTVVVTAATLRLLPERYARVDLGLRALKSVGRMRVFGVSADGAADGDPLRDERAMVGRRHELGLLLDRWEMVEEGVGQVVLVHGEPGIGKSRLVRELRASVGASATCIELRGSPFHADTPLYPFVEGIRRISRIQHGDDDAVREEKLRGFLLAHLESVDGLPVLTRLLRAAGQPDELQSESPVALRRQIIDTLIELALGRPDHAPTLLICEDTHWLDPTSLELIDRLVPRIPGQPTMLVLTSRLGPAPSWAGSHAQVTLNRLPRRHVDELVASITGGLALPEPVVHQLIEKSDGVPLFVEELTKMVLDASFLRRTPNGYVLVKDLPELSIPSTLRDSLTSRLDKLNTARSLVQVAATIGREFTLEMLSAVLPLDAETLEAELERLTDAELLYRRSAPPGETVYYFRHSLIRDASYSMLTRVDRQQHHARIAEALESRFPAIVEESPAIAAHHFTEAGEPAQAMRYWHLAGTQAASKSAHHEAIRAFERALAQCAALEPSAELHERELLIQTALGNSLRAVFGWSDPRVSDAYTRALELCAEASPDERAIGASWGLWAWHFVRADLARASDLAEKLVEFTRRAREADTFEVLAYQALGYTHFAQGDLAASNAEMRRALDRYDARQAPVYLRVAAQDPGAHTQVYVAVVSCLLGFPDRALEECQAALADAAALEHVFSEAIARAIALRVHQLRADPATLLQVAGPVVDLCSRNEFVHYDAAARIMQGWSLARTGEPEKGIELVEAGIDVSRRTQAEIYESHYLALLADSHLAAGDPRIALEILDEARALAEPPGAVRLFLAEIQRLQALAHRLGAVGDARPYLHEAIATARAQGARWFELRALADLVEVERGGENEREAVADLRAAYDAFSEGFDTPDVQRAASLLAG